jgi:hypothetical protein
LAALKQTEWKVSGHGGAAELLGIKPTTLASRMKKDGHQATDLNSDAIASSFLVIAQRDQDAWSTSKQIYARTLCVADGRLALGSGLQPNVLHSQAGSACSTACCGNFWRSDDGNAVDRIGQGRQIRIGLQPLHLVGTGIDGEHLKVVLLVSSEHFVTVFRAVSRCPDDGEPSCLPKTIRPYLLWSSDFSLLHSYQTIRIPLRPTNWRGPESVRLRSDYGRSARMSQSHSL